MYHTPGGCYFYDALKVWLSFTICYISLLLLILQVDFAMDVFKNLYPDQDVPEGLFITLLC